jgi:agmatinase
MLSFEPWRDLGANSMEEADVLVMGIPFDGAVSCGKGASFAPEKLRLVSRYLPPTTEMGEILDSFKIYDTGDIQADLEWKRYFGAVEDKAYNLMKQDKFCLFIGGDHSVTIPLHRAFGRYCKDKGHKKIGVIHFDSHCDICDSFDGHKWSHACTARRCLEDVIKPEDLTFLGIRSLEVDEINYLKANPEITVIYAKDFSTRGYMDAYKQIEMHYKDYDSIYFTLDIDVLDPAFAPGTGTPAAGGLTSRELMNLVQLMTANLPIAAMDVVEVSPELDCSNITVRAALKVIYEVFGQLNAKCVQKSRT